MEKDLENQNLNEQPEQSSETAEAAENQAADINAEAEAENETETVSAEQTENEKEVLPEAQAEIADNKTEKPVKGKKALSNVILVVASLTLILASVFLVMKLVDAVDNDKQNDDEKTTVTIAETLTEAEENETVSKESFLVPTEKAIAQVNGIEVSGELYDFYKAQNVYNFEMAGIGLNGLNKEIAAHIEQMCFFNAVQNALMEQLAAEQQIKVSEKDAQYLMDEIIAHNFSDKSDFTKWLDLFGGTEECYLKNCYYNLLGNALYMKCGENITVTEADAKALYDEDPSMYDTRTTSHILIKFKTEGEAPTEEEKMEAYNKALEVLQKVKAEPDKFADIAKEYSDDGSASEGGVIQYAFTCHDTSLFKEYVDGTWVLEGVGSFSPEPVESQAGYHIIRVDAEQKGFENFSEMIQQNIFSKKNEEKFGEIFNGFLDNSVISQQIDFLYAEDIDF